MNNQLIIEWLIDIIRQYFPMWSVKISDTIIDTIIDTIEMRSNAEEHQLVLDLQISVVGDTVFVRNFITGGRSIDLADPNFLFRYVDTLKGIVAHIITFHVA